MRKILHIDMDAFYASVEIRDRPELKGRPVIVGGRPEGRGVVCSASYEARKFGVRSAMSSRKALAMCPDGIFIPVAMSKYVNESRRIQAMFREVTTVVEPLSLDEAYLDVTTNLLNEPSATRIAQGLRERIFSETGLTASAGVGPNKFVAKIASDLRKPDALVVIPPDKVALLLEKLPVEKLWGVGPATARKLHAQGFFTTADLRAVPASVLQARLGRFGPFLHRLAHGIDDRPVRSERVRKSIGSENTFPKDIADRDVLRAELRELAADVARSVDRNQRPGRTLTTKIRFFDFQTITRGRTVDRPLQTTEELFALADELVTEALQHRPVAVRLLGISLSGFEAPEEDFQLRLPFDETDPPALA